MLRDRFQHAAVCRAICALADLHDVWADDGPTERALTLRDDPGLSTSGQTLLGIAWAVWNGDRLATVADVLKLDSGNTREIGTLLIALADGGKAVDEWARRFTETHRFDG